MKKEASPLKRYIVGGGGYGYTMLWSSTLWRRLFTGDFSVSLSLSPLDVAGNENIKMAK